MSDSVHEDHVEFQSGKVNGVFSIGSRIENLKESYEVEIKNFEAMKMAFALAGKALEDYRAQMMKELIEAKIPIKEVEIGKTYVSRCVDLIRTLYNDTEAKRLQASGAAEAISKVVASTKRVYDEETVKLTRFKEFAQDPKPKERPLGYPPVAEGEKKKRKTKKRSDDETSA